MHAPAKWHFLCKCNENCRRHTLCLTRQFEAVSCQNNAPLQAMFSCAEHPKRSVFAKQAFLIAFLPCALTTTYCVFIQLAQANFEKTVESDSIGLDYFLTL